MSARRRFLQEQPGGAATARDHVRTVIRRVGGRGTLIRPPETRTVGVRLSWRTSCRMQSHLPGMRPDTVLAVHLLQEVGIGRVARRRPADPGLRARGYPRPADPGLGAVGLSAPGRSGSPRVGPVVAQWPAVRWLVTPRRGGRRPADIGPVAGRHGPLRWPAGGRWQAAGGSQRPADTAPGAGPAASSPRGLEWAKPPVGGHDGARRPPRRSDRRRAPSGSGPTDEVARAEAATHLAGRTDDVPELERLGDSRWRRYSRRSRRSAALTRSSSEASNAVSVAAPRAASRASACE